MSKVKTKFKIKDIKITHAPGIVTNYGPLILGYLHGVPCLARREVLLLLGIKLSHTRQPHHFFHPVQILVKVGGSYFAVYSLKEQYVNALANQLHYRGYGVKTAMGDDPSIIIHDWKDGEPVPKNVTYDQLNELLKMATSAKPKTPHKRVSNLKLFWLAVKRLFSKGD